MRPFLNKAFWTGALLAIALQGLHFPLQAQDGLPQAALGVIAKRCLSCHSDGVRMAGLSLTRRELALQGGESGPALAPGKPGESLLFEKIAAGEMPAGNPLPNDERDLIRRWIAAGASWEGTLAAPAPRPRAGADWWSLQPLQTAIPPHPGGVPAEWKQNAIDRFVYAAMAVKNLEPAPPADRRALIRRATFDLLGLPPAPDEIEAFVNDPSDTAYEALIDRLLASPHYGERWGRHWLDVIRFGESHGYEQNHLRERAWPFRDYVIRSLNQDKPFNRMIVEHLAGDQVGEGDPDMEIGTGFLVAGVHDTVGIQNVEGQRQQRADDLDDMINATGGAFLGLTVNCARCHDHKFDPILQTDYYRMQAAFAGVRHGERVIAPPEEQERRRALENPLLAELERVEQRLDQLRVNNEARVRERREAVLSSHRPAVDSRGTEETFEPTAAKFVRMTITGVKGGAAALDEVEIWSGAATPVNVALASHGSKASARKTRTADGDPMFYSPEHVIDGEFGRLWISGESGAGQLTIEFPRVETIARIFWSRDRVGGMQERFLSNVPTQYVFEASLDGERWEPLASSEGRLPFTEEERERTVLLAALPADDRSEWLALEERRAKLEADRAALPKAPMAYAGRFEEPEEPSYLLKRGNPMDRGDVVAAASLSSFDAMLPGFELPEDASEGERRLALARWIADDRNALTARVLANRVWRYHFGEGLVATPSDFGLNGLKPTHPELLDWLAARLVDHGWRLKPLHKEIMLSAAYRQSSEHRAEFAAIDSEARYLWRFPPRRLDAEEVRDAILAVSGSLNRSMGGPGFRLYRYTVDNVATYYPLEEFGEETFRRSVYHQAARSVRVDLLGQFDCPDSTLPEPRRAVTTTPLQALTLLNNPFVTGQARRFAERLQREAPDDSIESQAALAFRLAFGRDAGPRELAAAAALAKQHGLLIFCRALLNANEFLYVM